MIDPQQVVERALAARTVDESLVIVTDASEASLRWANNSMTTNGVSLSRTWTVISIVREGDIAKVGTVSSSSVDPEQISVLVQASEEAARTATPADDASDLITQSAAETDWDLPAALTDIGVLCSVGCRPGEGLRRRRPVVRLRSPPVAHHLARNFDGRAT